MTLQFSWNYNHDCKETWKYTFSNTWAWTSKPKYGFWRSLQDMSINYERTYVIQLVAGWWQVVIVRGDQPSRLTVPLPQMFRDSESGLFHQKGLPELGWSRHSISQQYPAGAQHVSNVDFWGFLLEQDLIQRSCSHVSSELLCQLPPIRDKLPRVSLISG